MKGSPTSPSRSEQNSPHPPGTSWQNGQGGQAPPRPADIRADNRRDSQHDLGHGSSCRILTKRAPATPASASPTRAADHTHQVLADRRDQPVFAATPAVHCRQDSGRGGVKPNHCSTTSDSLTAAALTPLSIVTGR